jgi:hypothetical protein
LQKKFAERRRFPPPWSVEEQAACFVDAASVNFAHQLRQFSNVRRDTPRFVTR